MMIETKGMAMDTLSISIEIQGWNPDDQQQGKKLDESFSDLLWSTSNGLSTVFSERVTSDPVGETLKIARRLLQSQISIVPLRWHDDFVGYSDIASYVGMTSEAIRLLATGKRGPGDFPKPRAYIGIAANRSPIWTWAEVSPWFEANYEMEKNEHFPSNDQISEINARLAELRGKYLAKELLKVN
jgi:hypothetical protein